MSIIRTIHNKDNPYVMLNKSVLEDPELSWAAKGLWSYLMSRPDNWNVSVAHLSKIYNDKGGGERAIYSLLNELIDVGYCIRSQSNDENGRFQKVTYDIVELKNKVPRCSQADALQADALESPLNNKGSLTKKENDNKQPAVVSSKSKEKQSKTSPSSALLPDKMKILKDIDISNIDKMSLCKRFDGPTIERAVAWATHPQTQIKTTLIQALNWACSNPMEIPKDKKSVIQENKAYAFRIQQEIAKNAKYIPGLQRVEKNQNYFDLNDKTAEIGAYIGQDVAPQLIDYSDSAFKELLHKALKNRKLE